MTLCCIQSYDLCLEKFPIIKNSAILTSLNFDAVDAQKLTFAHVDICNVFDDWHNKEHLLRFHFSAGSKNANFSFSLTWKIINNKLYLYFAAITASRIFSGESCLRWCIARKRAWREWLDKRGLISLRMFGVSVKRPRLSRSSSPVFGLSVFLCERNCGGVIWERKRAKVRKCSPFLFLHWLFSRVYDVSSKPRSFTTTEKEMNVDLVESQLLQFICQRRNVSETIEKKNITILFLFI